MKAKCDSRGRSTECKFCKEIFDFDHWRECPYIKEAKPVPINNETDKK